MAVLALWVFSLVGILFGVAITKYHFDAEFSCGENPLATCQVSSLGDCARVLQSDWATLLDFPLTVYATAFYAVVFLMASAVLLRFRTTSLVRSLQTTFLAYAWVGVLISALLAGYALLSVGLLCALCVVFYVINAGLFVASWLLTPEGPTAGVASAARRRDPRELWSFIVATTVVVLLASLQVLVYRFTETGVRGDVAERCTERPEALPETRLVFGYRGKPTHTLAMFVDMSCVACSDEYERLHEKVASRNTEGAKLQLTVYHYPREGADCGVLDGDVNRRSKKVMSCQAALAIECAEAQHPNRGLELLPELFAHMIRGGTFEIDAIKNIASSLALEDLELDNCVRSPHARDRVSAHVAFGRRRGLRATPGLWIVTHGEDGSVKRLQRAPRSWRLIETMINSTGSTQ